MRKNQGVLMENEPQTHFCDICEKEIFNSSEAIVTESGYWQHVCCGLKEAERHILAIDIDWERYILADWAKK